MQLKQIGDTVLPGNVNENLSPGSCSLVFLTTGVTGSQLQYSVVQCCAVDLIFADVYKEKWVNC